MGWFLVATGTFLALSGMTVAVAVATTNKRELARLVSQRLRGFGAASRIISSQDKTVENANVVVSIGVLTAGFGLAASFRGLPPALSVSVAFVLAVPLAVCVMYALPRSFGRRWPGLFSGRIAGLIDGIGVVAALFRRSREERASDLLDTLRGGGEEETYQPKELAIVSGVLSFSKRAVRQIMTPRTEVVAVEEGTPIRELARIFSASGFSRLPVYRETHDNVTGMVYAFDLLKVEPGGELPLRPVSAVPESKACSDLLLEMQRDRRHMAVVLDEFGGMAGTVTMEDLLKELVRQLFGGFENPAPRTRPAERLECDATARVEIVAQHFGVDLGDPSETLGSLITGAAGRIPSRGERFVISGLEVEVLSATESRVDRLAIRRGPVPIHELSPAMRKQ